MKIGIVDTMFSRVNMGKIAIDELDSYAPDTKYIRRTVPGIKDLAVVCKNLLDSGCDIVIALGMVGGAPIDTQCAHEASLGIQMAKIATGKQIIEVFVHENEAWSETEFVEIAKNRVKKHVRNAVDIIRAPETLIERAGMGIRQGRMDEGEITNDTNENVQNGVIGIVVGTFHENHKKMLSIVTKVLSEHSHKYVIRKVPGVFDMPIMVKKLLMEKKVRGVIVLGAIEKGETHHGDVIGYTTAKTLQELSLEFKKPIALGIIGPGASEKNIEDRVRSHAEHAANAIIYMTNELKKNTV